MAASVYYLTGRYRNLEYSMSDEFNQCKSVFDCLLDADQKLWQAVCEIRDTPIEQLNGYVEALMTMRGELHVEFLRPIYKKYPELARSAGFDTDPDS